MIYNIKHVSLKRPNLAIISLKDIILTDDGEWKLLTIYIFQPNNCLLIFGILALSSMLLDQLSSFVHSFIHSFIHLFIHSVDMERNNFILT